MSTRRRRSTGHVLSTEDYRLLSDFRHVIRQFFVFSENAARAAGITAQQHRALLAIKAYEGRPTVGDLANQLVIKHHSAVGLADRLVGAGLISRKPDPADRRRVTLQVTAPGERMLLAISGANRDELRRLAPLLKTLVARLES
ncbi:MAG TPA: MarR family transcriptional regulator [Rhizomicrobium sp.]|nr:MarR family transcriptional regulator [Rhizomicrobium sp.]